MNVLKWDDVSPTLMQQKKAGRILKIRQKTRSSLERTSWLPLIHNLTHCNVMVITKSTSQICASFLSKKSLYVAEIFVEFGR